MVHNLPHYGEFKHTARNRIKLFLNSDSGYATAANVILALAAVGGILFIGATAPNLIQILGRHKRGKHYSKKQIEDAVRNLNKHGFVKIIHHKNGNTKILLTNKGKKRVRTFSISNLTIKKPKQWDKKWRVVIFDVPVEYNHARIALRNKLRKIGFYQLQQSVWVHPYLCEDELLFVAHFFKIEDCINILTVEKLLHEEKLRKIFKLT